MSILGYAKQEVLNVLKRETLLWPRHADAISDLKRDGVHVIPGFFNSEQCALLRAEIDRLIEKYQDQLWTDELKSDRRIYGAEKVSEAFRDYFMNAAIREIILEFERGRSIQGFTMPAKLEYREGNLGSGQGWHRDSAHYSQTKSIIYLSNVSEENGPFEYILGSHKPWSFMRGWTEKYFRYDQFRYSEAEIEQYKKRFPQQECKRFPAAEGTLILADTRGLHRGHPIRQGTRYAATNYFFVNVEPPPHLLALSVK